MDLKRFITSNKKILSVFFTVAISAFVVCTLVYGATTIGTNITTAGNIYATGTIVADGLVNAMGSAILGDANTDTLTVNSASTFNATTTLSGVGSDLIVSGVSTSTFAGTLSVAKSGATSTISNGSSGTAGAGGCISMVADDGVFVHLFVRNAGDHYEFSTSTAAGVCY